MQTQSGLKTLKARKKKMTVKLKAKGRAECRRPGVIFQNAFTAGAANLLCQIDFWR